VIKSTEAEQVRRVNLTVRLLQDKTSPAEVLEKLATRYRVSRRQAYRYLKLAQRARVPLPIPEPKIVFTVKLSPTIVRQVRRRARTEKRSISEWVDQVLRRSLQPPGKNG
jgi:predicted DNA-binding transcriptional regulator YafY